MKVAIDLGLVATICGRLDLMGMEAEPPDPMGMETWAIVSCRMEVGAARSHMNEGGAARSHREGTRHEIFGAIGSRGEGPKHAGSYG